MFRRSAYALDGAAMRFDERFNLSGGEDTFLFLSMRKRGVPIIWVQEALCSENVLPERATLSYRFGQTVQHMHIFGIINNQFLGPLFGRLKNLAFVVKMLFHCVSYLLAGAIVMLLNNRQGQIYLGVALRKLALSLGYCLALILPLKAAYKDVDGH